MDLSFVKRRLYPEELRKLNVLRKKAERAGGCRKPILNLIIALLLGAGFVYLAALPPVNFWTWLFGTAAVLAFGIVIFTPYELYKRKKQHAAFRHEVNAAIELGTVETCAVYATRIAIADEYEDEGVLYIVECSAHEVLYLWDTDYTLLKSFPCLAFEIYDESFSRILGRQVYPLSSRITPIFIDREAKWNHILKSGSPGHLSKEHADFDAIVAAYNAASQ